MANEPKINLALVGEMPENPVRGTVYMSPDASGNFVKVGVDGSVRTIFDGSDYVRKDESVWIPGYGEKSAVLANDYSYATGGESVSHGYMTYARGTNSHAEGMGCSNFPISVYSDFSNNIIYGAGNISIDGSSYIGLHVSYEDTYATIIDAYNDKRKGVVFVLDKPLLDDGSDFTVKTEVYLPNGGVAAGECSHTEGDSTVAMGDFSHAEGLATYAGSINSHAEGDSTSVYGDGAHAEGCETLAAGYGSHTEGVSTTTSGDYSHAEGTGTRASGHYSHAEGEGGEFSITINGPAGTTHYVISGDSLADIKEGDIIRYRGIQQKAKSLLPYEKRNPDNGFTYAIITGVHLGKDQYIEVNMTLNPKTAITNGLASVLQGVAEGTGSHSEGYYTNVIGSYSHTEGNNTVVFGEYSHAEGEYTMASAQSSHAEGLGTTASGDYSHVEGESTTASGYCSHAEGESTKTLGDYSHVEGGYTRTSNAYEHAQGLYNISHNYDTSFGNSGNTLNSIGIGVSDASRSNVIEVMQNGDVYVKGVGSYDGSNYVDASTLQEVINDGGGSVDTMISITYANLKNLRDTLALVPGMQYRITDYECTTTQADTSVAGNVFDIIVTADSSTELNENARAAHHGGDTYFQTCDLNAWELKYCLDNDTDRFVWADASKGKGVIYRMIDEWKNDCPYDFKNILFKRKLTNGALDNQGTDTWCYTFNGYNQNSTEYYDISSHMFYISEQTRQDAIADDDGADECDMCYNNVILPVKYTYREYYDVKVILNNIVFLSVSYDNGYDNGYDVAHCYGNAFSENCHNNTFSKNCRDNTFGENCYNNAFGENCYNNTFGKNCYENTFGDDCNQNSFGNACRVNLLGNSCYCNSFRNGCYSNSFGNGCSNNSFGNNCNNNSFMEGCKDNSFRNSCNNNSLGNTCYYNSFGNFCHYNSFGNLCQAITVFDNVFNCNITGGSYSAPVKNAQILNGTRGSTSSNKLTITFTADQNYTQIAGLNSSGVLKIWTPADLID